VPDEDANVAFYDADSSSYDQQRWTSRAGARTNRVQQRTVQDLRADWGHQRILEVGPGTARFTLPLTRKDNRMTLVDVSTGMLEAAQENLEEAGLDLVGHVGHVHTPRAIEKYRLDPLVLLEAVSRRGPLKPFAPVRFCPCRKAPVTGTAP
jgi:SAM-dependent methyltransferase